MIKTWESGVRWVGQAYVTLPRPGTVKIPLNPCRGCARTLWCTGADCARYRRWVRDSLNAVRKLFGYLERVPNGYIANQQELIDTLRQRLAAAPPPQ